MAGKFKISESENNNRSEVKDNNNHGNCSVWGCNRSGHVNIGKWYCRYHLACHGRDIGNQLNHVTLVLKNHEPEVNWYETLLSSSEVDWVCGDLKNRCPVGMEINAKESFLDYRRRIENKINELLKFKIMPYVTDRKMIAAGDKISDFLPEF